MYPEMIMGERYVGCILAKAHVRADESVAVKEPVLAVSLREFQSGIRGSHGRKGIPGEAEIVQVPLGNPTTPPPASSAALIAFWTAAVSSVTPSHTAPYFFTSNRAPGE